MLALREAEAKIAVLAAQLAESKEQTAAAETLNRMLAPYVPALLHVCAYLTPRAALSQVLGAVQAVTVADYTIMNSRVITGCQRLEAYLSQPFGRTVLQRCNDNERVLAGNGGVPHSAASLARRVYAVHDSLVKQQPHSQKRVGEAARKASRSSVPIFSSHLELWSSKFDYEWSDDELRAYIKSIRTPVDMEADLHLIHDFLSMHRVPMDASYIQDAGYEREWLELNQKMQRRDRARAAASLLREPLAC